MTPDDRAEFGDMIDDCFAAFDREPLPGAKEMFWDTLHRFRVAIVRRVFEHWVHAGAAPPTPAEAKRLAFELVQAEKTGATVPASGAPVAVRAEASPWVPLCWSTSIGLGVVNPDVTYKSPRPASAGEYRQFIESIAQRVRARYGDNDRKHPETATIRRHVARLIRDRVRELGWPCRPRPQYAAIIDQVADGEQTADAPL